MEEKKLITYEGLRDLEEELQDLKVNRRREIADKIKVAREQGDLSENAEYDAAKDEQRDIEARIDEIENILKIVEVVDEDEIDAKKVSIGSRILQICSGIKEYYKPEDLVGRTVMVLVNLKPRKMAGLLSEGMLLCAEDENGAISLMTPADPSMPAGSVIC